MIGSSGRSKDGNADRTAPDRPRPLRKRWRRARWFALLCATVAQLAQILPSAALAQGWDQDAAGHCKRDQMGVIFACWNPDAGNNIPNDLARYPEDLPNLEGWDFRINFPHVRFQLSRSEVASAPAMVGVIEDDAGIYAADGKFQDYGHRDNSIWLFRIEQDGLLYYKVFPSRRQFSSTTNIHSFEDRWLPVNPAGPVLKMERPAVTVVGEGFGEATIHVVARTQNNSLFSTSRVISSGNTSTWPEPWRPVGASSSTPPALTTAFDDRVALATMSVGHIELRLLDPLAGSWSAPTDVGIAAPQTPRLIWDGKALNAFFVRNERIIHSYATSSLPLSFENESEVSFRASPPLLLQGGDFDVVAFNQRFHIAARRQGSWPQQVWYTKSTTPYGVASGWTEPSDVGFGTSGAPRIATLYEQLFVIGVNASGAVVYSRRDPNRALRDLAGNPLADRWLTQGEVLDDSADGIHRGLEVLAFNTDLYLAANSSGSGTNPDGLYVVNFGRGALKRLMTERWGMELEWGTPGASPLIEHDTVGREVPIDFAQTGEIPALADVNQDDLDDLIKFVQVPVSGEGTAPVYVRRNLGGFFGPVEKWHSSFAPLGESPMVGDFDGDGDADLVSVDVLDGEVRVALSTGNGFDGGTSVWQTGFGFYGQILVVGNFDGELGDDIARLGAPEPQVCEECIFVTGPDGKPIEICYEIPCPGEGNAPVKVALSRDTNGDGRGDSFGPTQTWWGDFEADAQFFMSGDFDGDGRDDLVAFHQGVPEAPVVVARSGGDRFLTPEVWHPAFSRQGAIPLVADFDLDGDRDDIAMAFSDAGPAGSERNIRVAFSDGTRFARDMVWHSDFVAANQVRVSADGVVRSPVVGRIFGDRLWQITQNPQDLDTFGPDVVAFRNDGAGHRATTLGTVPLPTGVPWERYKWFVEKAVGVALFPEWIYAEGPNHCVSPNHSFGLLGLAGVGGAELTASSVRSGGGAGHVSEELGHSIFANCFHQDVDHFEHTSRPNYASIFETPATSGGVGSNDLATCPGLFPNWKQNEGPCRDREHYFLGLLNMYRLKGDAFRARIESVTDSDRKELLLAQYEWFRTRWYEGAEFTEAPATGVSLAKDVLRLEEDYDGDGVKDGMDNCADAFNPNQGDSDGDGVGNPCDPTPVPEPVPALMLVLGAALLGALARRRQQGSAQPSTSRTSPRALRRMVCDSSTCTWRSSASRSRPIESPAGGTDPSSVFPFPSQPRVRDRTQHDQADPARERFDPAKPSGLPSTSSTPRFSSRRWHLLALHSRVRPGRRDQGALRFDDAHALHLLHRVRALRILRGEL